MCIVNWIYIESLIFLFLFDFFFTAKVARYYSVGLQDVVKQSHYNYRLCDMIYN